MAWTEHVVWWHVYPLGFTGADTTGADRTGTDVPRLRALLPWLDHLIDLGANGLALGPVFESSTHGYDTIDWFRVDPRLGTEHDLLELIDAAHAKGIRVMLDGVFNHVGPEFPALQAARRDPTGDDASLFSRSDTDGNDNDNDQFRTFEGHGGLIELDHSSPRVAQLITDVMTYWCDRGVDAWRLDAAYSVPSEFWATVLPRVRELHPDVYVMGEVIQGDYVAAVEAGGLDSVTQYELWQGIWHALQSVNLHELEWALRRHNDFLDHFMPYTFIGNHDVTRIASQIDDDRHHGHAVALLFALGGTPSIYYGDEFGLRGVKEECVGGDDAIRPAFPRQPDHVPDARPEVLALHQELIGVRRRHPWLHSARSRTVEVTNESLVLELTNGADTLLVSLNLGDTALASRPVTELLAAREAGVSGNSLDVGPHGWAIALIEESALST
jgi:cyclomaltodextrinase